MRYGEVDRDIELKVVATEQRPHRPDPNAEQEELTQYQSDFHRRWSVLSSYLSAQKLLSPRDIEEVERELSVPGGAGTSKTVTCTLLDLEAMGLRLFPL